MHLWSDWNLQVSDWCKKHADGSKYISGGMTNTITMKHSRWLNDAFLFTFSTVKFDYLVLRSEDHLEFEPRLNNLLYMADFTGSPKRCVDLCCMAMEGIKDMGMSNRLFSNASMPMNETIVPLDERYGKWKTKLENRTDLLKHMHEYGSKALQRFGYDGAAAKPFTAAHGELKSLLALCRSLKPTDCQPVQ